MSWFSHFLRTCVEFFHGDKREERQDYISIVNETGNVVLQVAPDTDPNALDPKLWRSAFGHFALALKLLGPYANHYRPVTGYLSACPWFKVTGTPTHFREKVKQKEITKYLAQVLYENSDNPAHLDKAQRLLMTLTTRALKLSASGKTKLTVALLKCRYEEGRTSSQIYIYSFDLDSLHKTQNLFSRIFHGKTVELDIQEERFLFIPPNGNDNQNQ